MSGVSVQHDCDFCTENKATHFIAWPQHIYAACDSCYRLIQNTIASAS